MLKWYWMKKYGKNVKKMRERTNAKNKRIGQKASRHDRDDFDLQVSGWQDQREKESSMPAALQLSVGIHMFRVPGHDLFA